MRKTIIYGLTIVVVTLMVLSVIPQTVGESQTTRGARAGWWDSAWSYRAPIDITEQSGNALTNYQVKIIAPYDSDMNSDFSDLRFTDGDGTTLLSHWLESHTASTTATVWVKVPSIPASLIATIYMYYGNSGASDASDGDATFAFFDDFDDGTIDTSKWYIYGSPTESGGTLTASRTSYVMGTSTFLYHAMRSSAKISGSGAGNLHRGFGFCYRTGNIDSATIMYHRSRLNTWVENNGGGTYTGFGNADVGAFHTWDMTWKSGNVRVYSDGILRTSQTSRIPDEAINPKISMSTGYTVEADWYLIRQFKDPEPTYQIGPEEVGGIPATVDLKPETLNLKSMGNWVTVKILDFPENPEYDVSQVIDGSVKLENIDTKLTPTNSGGSSDGQYMCKADRLAIEELIGVPGEDVELTITGDVADTSFMGTCTIDVIHGT